MQQNFRSLRKILSKKSFFPYTSYKN